MKVTVEINDQDVKDAIRQQMTALISQEVARALSSTIDEIIAKKFARVDQARVEEVLKESAKALIVEQYRNNQWSVHSAVKEALADAAMKVIRGSK